MKIILNSLIVLFCFGCTSKPVGPIISIPIVGSNFVMSSIGKYLTDPIPENWNSDNMRPVVGTYHLNPDLVRQELKTMFDNGQRKISIVIWFNHTDQDVNAHVINSSGGKLPKQQMLNLLDLMNDILNTGFNEILIRFAQQGVSDPSGWTEWNEEMLNENWSFISTTRLLIEPILKGIPHKYDLGVELGGLDSGQAERYQRSLWLKYVLTFGSQDSVGFSVAYAPDRLKKLFANGIYVNQWAIDIYDNVYAGLKQIKEDMKDMHFIISETYYKDLQNQDEVNRGAKDFNLNIDYILQWPLSRGSTAKHFSIDYPSEVLR